MENFLTCENINWNNNLNLFNIIKNIQVIFIIPKNETNNCLKIGTFNNNPIYDITFSKIKKLKKIGPYITKKIMINDDNNIEYSIIEYFKQNKFYKWIGITDESIINFKDNIFKYLLNDTKNIVFLIPHRNREETLNKTIEHINDYIINKNIEADIWIIQQNDYGNWNKGTTLNIGYLYLKQFYKYFIFNDGDTYFDINYDLLYPEEDEIIHYYGYDYCLGGIFACQTDVFSKINGYNNNFFNWGREDRMLEDRCLKKNISINRNYKININQNGIKQLEHENELNYWNNNNFKNRDLYYLNQIEHFKESLLNGLSNLKNGEINNNRKIYIFINLIKWTQGEIKISIGEIIFYLKIYPNDDTGKLKVIFNNIITELPINPDEKYPKLIININKDKNINITIKYNYLFNHKFEINSDNNINVNINIKYTNIELDFDNIYTTFNKKKINYYHYPTLKNNFNQLNIFF